METTDVTEEREDPRAGPGGDGRVGGDERAAGAAFPLKDRVTPTIFEKSSPGRKGVAMPEPDVPVGRVEERIPARHLRQEPPRLPEVPEHEAVRHYTEISLKNHHVDRALYPLGSCTMKYNPKVNEQTARIPGLAGLHPLTPESATQGALRLMWELGEMLKEIAGMEAVTLQPPAGAQGELTGVYLMKAYHRSRGDGGRRRILIPDSAHGTNPATVARGGFDCETLESNEDGRIDLDALAAALDDDVAGLMLTNPNTLGVFETEVAEISRMVHDVGGLMYMDGANLNALMGIARPAAMGYDIVHFNLHKTFSTPHGGGGPGAGPVTVRGDLAPFLPVPHLERRESRGDAGGDGPEFLLDWDRPESIGKVHGFFGNFGVMVRAYTYIRMLGREGVRETAEAALLNNAYLSSLLREEYPLPYGRGMHESVFTGDRLKSETGAKTMDVAKRLLDYGFHAPTIYFPLIVSEALMTEPTETETREELDRYARAMVRIAREAREEPSLLRSAPFSTPVRRLDEGRAGRQLDVRWSFEEPE